MVAVIVMMMGRTKVVLPVDAWTPPSIRETGPVIISLRASFVRRRHDRLVEEYLAGSAFQSGKRRARGAKGAAGAAGSSPRAEGGRGVTLEPEGAAAAEEGLGVGRRRARVDYATLALEMFGELGEEGKGEGED